MLLFRSSRMRACLALAAFVIAGSAQTAAQSIRDTDLYRRIRSEVDKIWIVDTHEHLADEETYLKRPADFLARMLHYVDADLMASGMPRVSTSDPAVILRVQDPAIPLEERVPLFLRHWQFVKTTGYGRALTMVVKDLYGADLDHLTPDSCRELNARITAANKPGLYRHILRDKARVDLSIVVSHQPRDPEFFRRHLRIDRWVKASSRKVFDALAADTGVPIRSLADVVHALEVDFDRAVKNGAVGAKSALAYDRSLSFPQVTETEAEAAFKRLLDTPEAARGAGAPFSPDLKLYGDYMMHRICDQAARHKLPFQIHTGLQTGGPHVIADANPALLTDLFLAHPEVNFILLHTYPYGHTAGALAKMFPNVYLDMTWLYIISPRVAEDSLAEFIETVPGNKILGFGGDYGYVEGVYAHAVMAREVIAAVLARKVQDRYLTEAEATDLATRLLRTNALELYKLPSQK
ncbi:MAG: amidohydrolase family protein [Acidobacteria bacterium]|nr:amidohydrolase family protein [Acidobacteriota bacterium]